MARTRQNTTVPDSLSDEQINAIGLVLAGKSDAEVGETVGVSRQTVNEWKNKNYTFKRALGCARKETWNNHVDRMRSLVGRALEVLSEDLGSEDLRLRQAAAVHVLKSVGLYGSDLEPGDPDMAGLFDFSFG